MENISEILRKEEEVSLRLRSIYRKRGYTSYKMGKFEEYDLYSRNKDFLVSEGVITFNDTDGRLLALKPDVTLSIANSLREDGTGVRRLCYNESVYRVSEQSRHYREITQAGLECLGAVGPAELAEVTELAAESLQCMAGRGVLSISHLGILKAVMGPACPEELQKALGEKNLPALNAACEALSVPEEKAAILRYMLTATGEPAAVAAGLKKLCGDEAVAAALEELIEAAKAACAVEGIAVTADLSLTGDMRYYNGLVFRGYAEGIPTRVLSGGRYDRLMEKLGKKAKAVGFAVYLDCLEQVSAAEARPREMLYVALPKGRLGEKVYAMFAASGYSCPEVLDDTRKLLFVNEEKGVCYFWVKPSDVAIYVERGAADIGVAGKDILLEYNPDVYELLDLEMGKCRMCVAGRPDFEDDPDRTLRVATKFPHIAEHYYRGLGRDIDIIKLNGSIELAPLLNLSDVIVDIVETGTTLKENGLAPLETVVPISARLIANRSAFQFKKDAVLAVQKGLEEAVQKKKEAKK